jgi:hypothetical protein
LAFIFISSKCVTETKWFYDWRPLLAKEMGEEDLCATGLSLRSDLELTSSLPPHFSLKPILGTQKTIPQKALETQEEGVLCELVSSCLTPSSLLRHVMAARILPQVVRETSVPSCLMPAITPKNTTPNFSLSG